MKKKTAFGGGARFGLGPATKHRASRSQIGGCSSRENLILPGSTFQNLFDSDSRCLQEKGDSSNNRPNNTVFTTCPRGGGDIVSAGGPRRSSMPGPQKRGTKNGGKTTTNRRGAQPTNQTANPAPTRQGPSPPPGPPRQSSQGASRHSIVLRLSQSTMWPCQSEAHQAQNGPLFFFFFFGGKP